MRNTQGTHEVAIFWDYENCPAPSNASGFNVVKCIRNVAQCFGSIKLFKAYLEVSSQLPAPRALALRSELQSSGVSLTDCPHNGRKDVADKMIIVDMLAHAIDHPAPYTIFLISGDRDFAYPISILTLRQYNVVLLALPNAHVSLTSQASVCLDWAVEVLQGIEEDSLPNDDTRTRYTRQCSSGAAGNGLSSSLPAHPRGLSYEPECDAEDIDISQYFRGPTNNSERATSFSTRSVNKPSTQSIPASNLRTPIPNTSHLSTLITPSKLDLEVDDIAANPSMKSLGVHSVTPTIQSVVKLLTVEAPRDSEPFIEAKPCAPVKSQGVLTSPPSKGPLISSSSGQSGNTQLKPGPYNDIAAQYSRPFSAPATMLSTAIQLPPTVVQPPPNVIQLPATVIKPPPTVMQPLPSTVIKPPSTVIQTPPMVAKPPSTIVQPPTTTIQPSLTVVQPPLKANQFPSTAIQPTLSSSSSMAGAPPTRAQVAVSPNQSIPKPRIYPAHFKVLVDTLEYCRKQGSERPLRSIVAAQIVMKDVKVYEKAGVAKFAQYVALAQKATLVQIGGSNGTEWISLLPNWYGASTA